MSPSTPTIIRLTEYEPQTPPPDTMDEGLARLLWSNYRDQVSITPPSFMNGHQWVLTAQSWVGHIPLTPDLRLVLEPKVPLGNLFRMLEYAYRLARFDVGLVATDTLEEVYQSLAVVLGKQVLDRARQGLYRAYVPRQQHTPYVRGRLDMNRMMRSPWEARLDCQYQEHTADIEDNRILAWTLFGILRSGICDDEGQRVLRQAFQQVQHCAALEAMPASVCAHRDYHRLNEDYRPLHGLCHFFLDGSGPTHRVGEHTMVPFLVDMARLFEQFVAEWLTAHLPQGFHVVPHYRVDLNQFGSMYFDIDLVLWDEAAGAPLCVLDTKYKKESAAPDVHQIVAYAQSVGCRYALLVYPGPLAVPVSAEAGDISIRSLIFDVGGDLELAGERMLADLAAVCSPVTL
ncbi:MAG: restriction endonuclease [Chloroflexi bacterium]|nr:restriction endonuclease [Chloroflexota bacterium]